MRVYPVSMHPSRLVALCFFVVGVFLLAQIGVAGKLRIMDAAMLQVIGGIFLLLTGLVGFFRYEANPIVSEYGSVTYLLIFGLFIWAAGLLSQLVTA